MSHGDFRIGDEQFTSLFTLIRVIGSGSFGTVVHVIDKQSGEECAVKAISKLGVSCSHLDDLRTEAAILSTLDHPNVVKFRQLKETPTQVYLVMEMVYGGTLASLIAKRPLSEKDAAKAMKGVFSAVKYLHAKGVIHRDIKPENILVENPGDLSSIKIADFGLSQQFQRYEINTSDDFCGTIWYMAPEQLERKYYSKAVDIWSCGIMLFVLCTGGKHPLMEKGDTNEEYFGKLNNPQWKLGSLSALAKNLFLRLVKHQPVERYSASQALLHPWVSGETRDIPLTAFEQFRLYNDEIRRKKVPFHSDLMGDLFPRPHHQASLSKSH